VESTRLVIKRYPNRKLYNTEQKKYITLDGIAELIRSGSEVQVIDNNTGEDLTALTLTQIILEQEKKNSGLVSHTLLTNLIRAGEDSLTALQRGFKSSLGFWNQIDEEIKIRIQYLVKKGEMSAIEAEKLLDKLIDQKPIRRQKDLEVDAQIEINPQALEEYLIENQIPTQKDINQIYKQLEELTTKLEDVIEDQS
jgi:polyhydroxyalkanoate synthesis repressor PhaR